MAGARPGRPHSADEQALAIVRPPGAHAPRRAAPVHRRRPRRAVRPGAAGRARPRAHAVHHALDRPPARRAGARQPCSSCGGDAPTGPSTTGRSGSGPGRTACWSAARTSSPSRSRCCARSRPAPGWGWSTRAAASARSCGRRCCTSRSRASGPSRRSPAPSTTTPGRSASPGPSATSLNGDSRTVRRGRAGPACCTTPSTWPPGPSTRRDDITIEGLDACRPMFGI